MAALFQRAQLESGLLAGGYHLTPEQLEQVCSAANDELGDWDPRNTVGPNPGLIPARFAYKSLRFVSGQSGGPSLGDAFSKLLSGDFSGFWDTLTAFFSGATADTDRASSLQNIGQAMATLRVRLDGMGGEVARAADAITGNVTRGIPRQSWSLYDQATRTLGMTQQQVAAGYDLPSEQRYQVANVTTNSAPLATPGNSATASLTSPSPSA